MLPPARAAAGSTCQPPSSSSSSATSSGMSVELTNWHSVRSRDCAAPPE
jgi:hypothetical protein